MWWTWKATLPASNLSTTLKKCKSSNQIDQYTELNEEQQQAVEQTLPVDVLRGFKGQYLETAQDLKRKQDLNSGDIENEVEQLDFEFVLFASAVIDYDYIVGLIAKSTQGSSKQKWPVKNWSTWSAAMRTLWKSVTILSRTSIA